MRLARKLQLAYLSLLMVPVLTISILVIVTYYTSSSTFGPYADMDAPGWLKGELTAILDEDWEGYESLKEKMVIFLSDSEGYMRFPVSTENGIIPSFYPHFTPPESGPGADGSRETPETNRPRVEAVSSYLPDIYARYGTEWALDLSITPISVNGEKFIVAWREPRHGVPGFIARRGWVVPIFILTGVMLIPAFIDMKLRRSINRLQEVTVRLSSGNLDEAIMVHPRDDLADLARSLEKTRVELKESRDRKARVLMAVSHDLRTPLTSIKGYIEALSDGMARNEEETRRYYAVLEEKAALLGNRIDELIDFSRSETGGWKKPTVPVDTSRLMNRLDAAFRQDSGFLGRKYSSYLDIPGNTVINGDEKTLYRAWENLFSNAVNHTVEGDTIVFRVGVEAGLSIGADNGAENGDASSEPLFLFGEIADSGEGVSEDFVPLLFEAFTRGDKGRNSRGLGLGLASVRSVATAYGGTVEYRSGETGGAVFRLRLPCGFRESPGL